MTEPSEPFPGSPAELFRVRNARILRPTGEVVLESLSWTIRVGERWAIVGPIGSGKTTVTEVLTGRLPVAAGEIHWPILNRLRAAGSPISFPSEAIGRVAFKEDSAVFSYGRHYYQQRYNFIEPEDDLTLDEFLRAGTRVAEDTLAEVTERLGLSDLRTLSFIKLSNGQTRRARIARALLARPAMLILDDPFVGLDYSGRQEVTHQLQRLTAAGTSLVLVVAPDSIPEWVTHVLELRDRRVTYHGPRKGFHRPAAAGDQIGHWSSMAGVTVPIVELTNVTVVYGGRPVLRNVSWTVRTGERWAIFGPNGSGKTTLLSLICGDHPQAYSNDVSVFGRRRGTGESIWDLKRRVGLVSPEIHLYYGGPLTAREVAATGFFDVLVSRPTSPQQDAAVRELIDFFGVTDFADRPFGRLSTGQQRIVFLLRALVKDPPLLILDEPFQALDSITAGRARDWIDHRLALDRTVLFATHNQLELPRTVTRRLWLAEGAVQASD